MKQKLPPIEWVFDAAFYTSPEDDGVTLHNAEGFSEDHRAWVGVGVFEWGELKEIVNIENP
jgi:hypothetical protein